MKNKKETVKKVTKTFYVELDGEGETTGNVYKDVDEVKECCSGGDIVAEVKVVKKFEIVDDSVKLVEIK